jgi:hypothetical protein
MKEGSCCASVLEWSVNVGPEFVPTDAGQPLYFQAALRWRTATPTPLLDRLIAHAKTLRQRFHAAGSGNGLL